MCLRTNTPTSRSAQLSTAFCNISLAALLPPHYLFIAKSGEHIEPQPRRIVRPGLCDIGDPHPLWFDGGPEEALKCLLPVSYILGKGNQSLVIG